MQPHPDYDNLLQFKNFKKHTAIEHFFTTRHGGVSKGEFSSFNLGNYSDDSPTDIYENRQRLAHMWYMEENDFIIPHQTHDTNVLIIDDIFLNLNTSAKIEALYGVDATITDKHNLFLCVTTADCVPILLFDKEKNVIGGVHAGWKSIVGGIINNTISKFKSHFNSNPNNIVVAIGPSISINNYEVGNEVIEKFKALGFDLSEASYFNVENQKHHIDLKTICQNELVRQGLLPENIEKSDLCTYENPDLFFSARRQSIHCGRMLSGIIINTI